MLKIIDENYGKERERFYCIEKDTYRQGLCRVSQRLSLRGDTAVYDRPCVYVHGGHDADLQTLIEALTLAKECAEEWNKDFGRCFKLVEVK